jgi:hypothetical protein
MIDNPGNLSPFLEIAREARSSIELSRDAKGVYRWDLKIYWDAQEDDESGVLAQLSRLDEQMRQRFLPKGGSE